MFRIFCPLCYSKTNKSIYKSLKKSSISDSLTLQLWKDRKDWERNPPSKGSIALEEYLGWEAGFTLDRESQTLALILKSDIICLAFEHREVLIRWQVRVTNQFEEGQHFSGKSILG